MKILYFSQFYFPENAAASFRATEHSRIWNKEGHEVTIFTTYPNFPSGKINDGYSNRLLSEEYIDSIRVLRSKIFTTKNTSKIKKIISSLSYIILGLVNFIFNRKKIGKKYDCVLGTSGTIFNGILAYIYSKVIRKPFIFELRDLTYIQLLAVYSEKQTLIYHIIKFIEIYLCKQAKAVVVVTVGFKKKLSEEGIYDKKISVIFNGIQISEEEEKEKVYLEEVNNKFIISYMGNLGQSQNLEYIIDVFNKLNINNKELYFIGEGAIKGKLKKISESYNDIFILDGMTRDKLDKYYKVSDVCVVSLKNSDMFKATIPSKIFEIMYKNKMILFFGPHGEATSIIEKSRSGIVCSSNINDEEITYLSNKLLDKKYVKECGELGHKFVVDNFDRKKLAFEYIRMLEQLI